MDSLETLIGSISRTSEGYFFNIYSDDDFCSEEIQIPEYLYKALRDFYFETERNKNNG